MSWDVLGLGEPIRGAGAMGAGPGMTSGQQFPGGGNGGGGGGPGSRRGAGGGGGGGGGRGQQQQQLPQFYQRNPYR